MHTHLLHQAGENQFWNLKLLITTMDSYCRIIIWILNSSKHLAYIHYFLSKLQDKVRLMILIASDRCIKDKMF